MRKLKRRIIYTLSVTLSISVLFFILTPPLLINNKINYIYYMFHPEDSIYCYNVNDGISLKDISDVEPKKDRSIFFHETSCNSYLNGNKILLNPRQACAVESAAKLHPDHDVYLLFTSTGQIDEDNEDNNKLINALRNYPNIYLLHLNFTRYIKDTRIEFLYKNGHLKYSAYARSHASDLLRYLTLYKYGGIYMDLDVIVIKPLTDLSKNFAGAESKKNVAAGVLRFTSKDKGHDYLNMCLDDLKNNFDGNNWGNNGPGVITRLTKNLCKSNNINDIINKDCDSFKIYPKEIFYPIEWQNWSFYFDVNRINHVMKLCENSYTIHVWNQLSNKYKIPVNVDVPYTIFAKKFCPKVFSTCEKYF